MAEESKAAPQLTSYKDPNTGEFVTVPTEQAPPRLPPGAYGAGGSDKRRTSLVRGAGDWDFKFHIDNIGVYAREMSEELREYVESGYVRELAAALGCDASVTSDNDALGQYLRQDGTGKLMRIARAKKLEHDNRIISECVVDWDSPEPCASYKLKVSRVVKAAMVKRIIGASELGLEDADFLASS